MYKTERMLINMMKKLQIAAALACGIAFVAPQQQVQAKDSAQVTHLKKIKKDIAQKRTPETKSLKLGQSYKKAYQILGKPTVTQNYRGVVYLDTFKNGTSIYVDAKIKGSKLVRTGKVLGIRNNYVVKYKDIKKVFGKTSDFYYSSSWGTYNIGYYVKGKYDIQFSVDEGMLRSTKLTDQTVFYTYQIGGV